MLLRRMNGKFHHITVIALYQQLCLKQYETYAASFVLFGAKRKQGQKQQVLSSKSSQLAVRLSQEQFM